MMLIRLLLLLAVLSVGSARGDHFSTLGVRRGASVEDVRGAYKKLARQYHPDKNKNDPAASDKFIKISEAHEVLTDQTKRRDVRVKTAAVAGGGGGGCFFSLLL